jgi:hypothetical protein
MLISDSHQFIFVHNYKVAGNSIKRALWQWASPPMKRELNWFERQLARIGIRGKPQYPSHLTALEIRERFPEVWDDYFTFGFVRNPWSWQVSLYFFMLQNEDHWFHDDVKSMDGFEEYIEWRVREGRVLQSSFFYDEDGEAIVDYIGRLENIRDDFQQICERVGVDATLPHKNKSSHADYREYYSDYTRNLIADHFAEDIDRFGYSFHGSTYSTPVLTP